MEKSTSTPVKTPPVTPEQAIERYAVMDRAIRQGGFQIDEIESALGMYMVGFHFGWRILYLIHTKKTIRKYETLLNIKVAETFPEYGPDVEKTNAHKILKAASSFWKVVSGDEKTTLKVDKRSVS